MNRKKINDLELERFLLNELPDHRMQAIALQMESDRELQEEVNRLKTSNRDILEAYPPETMTIHIENLYESQLKKEKAPAPAPTPGSSLLRKAAYASPLLAMALVLVIFILPGGDNSTTPVPTVNKHPGDTQTFPGPHVTRIKGKPFLNIFRDKANSIDELREGALVEEGDVLQIIYNSEDASHGVILSVDGGGTVTLHYPEHLAGSTSLKTKKAVYLNNAYQLDDAPVFERFFFITSKEPVRTKLVMARARILATDPDKAQREDITLEDMPDYRQDSILLKKIK